MSLDVVVMLHSHLPYVLNHGRWPHGSDWICEAALDSYLPLLSALEDLRASGIPAPLTIGVTPVLASQLSHVSFIREFEDYVKSRIAACDDAVATAKTSGNRGMKPILTFWRSRLTRLLAFFRQLEGDILGALRRFQDDGSLEVTTSAATHAFLPLLGRDESIDLQLTVGAAEHRRLFGQHARGCWLPECGYRSSGCWSPIPGVSRDRFRSGLEGHLSAAGFRYTFADAHMASAGDPLGVYAELFGGEAEHVALGDSPRAIARSPYDVYRLLHGDHPVDVMVRDPRSSMQVWSRYGGYPGSRSYLEFHKLMWPGGFRMWRVSAPESSLDHKELYDPGTARDEAHRHAAHFVNLLAGISSAPFAEGGRVVVAPFDTELFGHWWFEGPEFLAAVYRELAGQASLRGVTAGEHLDSGGPGTPLSLQPGSWGRNGDYTMWLSDVVNWTWPIIWRAEDRFWSLAPRALGNPGTHRILEQAARELLLLQSSDWQFIMSTGEVGDYAVRRFTRHAQDCNRLLNFLDLALAGGDVDGGVTLSDKLKRRDDIFGEMLPAIASVLGRTAGDPDRSCLLPSSGVRPEYQQFS